MKVTIDPTSGFCFGVKNAIEIAEHQLKTDNTLYSLGEIVHNPEEIKRLEKVGLRTIDHATFEKIKGKKVFLRAHGEPPLTYDLAKSNHLEIIDATCPIVLKLQEKVRLAHGEMEESDGQIILFGKKDHPEMIGLIGQTNNSAIVVENENDLNQINLNKPIRLFSQTTKSKEQYQKIIDKINHNLDKKNKSVRNFIFTKSVCGQVANRVPELKSFCKSNDVIIFVSGKNSSNGKYLFTVCQSANPNSYHISSPTELNMDWIKKKDSIGISGATSTPVWLLEKVSDAIKLITDYN